VGVPAFVGYLGTRTVDLFLFISLRVRHVLELQFIPLPSALLSFVDV
jgi:hypothetical protein